MMIMMLLLACSVNCAREGAYSLLPGSFQQGSSSSGWSETTERGTKPVSRGTRRHLRRIFCGRQSKEGRKER